MAQSFTCSRCRQSITTHHKDDLAKWWQRLDDCQLTAQCQLCGAPGRKLPILHQRIAEQLLKSAGPAFRPAGPAPTRDLNPGADSPPKTPLRRLSKYDNLPITPAGSEQDS